jgi:hypothetical protein
MLRQVFYIIVYAYILPVCLGLWIFAPDWLAGGRQQSGGGDYHPGLLNSEVASGLVKTTDMLRSREAAKVAQLSHTAAVHAGATLIKRPPPAKVVQSNTAAVHAGATLIKRPPPAKVVQSNTAAVHTGATLIKWPPPAKVQSNTAAVHAGATLIKWPPPAKVVQSNTAAVHAGETLINWPSARVVQSNTAAVHAGETPINWPLAAKAVRSNMVAVHAGETLINWPSPPEVVLTDQRKSTSMPQMLQSAQVDTGALHSISRPFFGMTAEPAPTKLRNEVDGNSSTDSDSIPPKAIRKVFTLACSLLRPAIAAGKLSIGQGMEIGRMQDDYLKKAECLAAAKRAARIAKRKIGCSCTVETKELDAAAQAPPAPAVDYKLLMELRSRSRYFPRSKPRIE